MLKVSILSIGDEICIGQIVNTNAAWMAKEVSAKGAAIVRHYTVGDDADEIKSGLKELLSISDIVLLTGGLGPTHDDMTKAVLLDFFNDELSFHDESYRNILELLQKRGIVPTNQIKQMAMLPKTCLPLANAVGAAPGMLFEYNNKHVISMPGVPNEMKYIMQNSVLPLIEKTIRNRKEDVVLYKTLITSGVAESVLADKIGIVDDFLGANEHLAFLPSYRGVKLRIGVESKDFESCRAELKRIESYITEKVGEYVVASEDIPLSAVIGRKLIEKGETLSLAESCTGGLLGAEFTDISGSSAYFLGGIIAYSNDIKENILGVNHQTLLEHGAVSRETAEEMARNVREKFQASYGISITGIAGPTGGSPEKPVGTVWIGLSTSGKTIAQKFIFTTDRDVNRKRAVGMALSMILEELK